MSRTIIVSDVHGCSSELRDLLERTAPTSDDRIFFVGDLVVRGPDPHGVLKLARELGGRSVLGNHEHRLIAARVSREQGKPGPRMGTGSAALFDELTHQEWDLLLGMPLKIDLPEHELRIVHAGVVPGVPFEELDAQTVTRMRSLNEDGSPSDKWGTLWGTRYVGPPHVVFGHNARALPQIHRDATGIDTGCVYGGHLTALILSSGQKLPPPADRLDVLVSVPARQAYADFGRPLPRD